MTFEEIRETISNLPKQISKDDKETKLVINKVASQIGYSIPDASCRCADKYNDLIIKLKLWLKDHKDGLSKYRMKPGIVRYTPFGNAYNLNITDEMAEWLLENDSEASRFIVRIVEDTPESGKEDSNINYQKTEDNVEEVAQAPKKRRRRKVEDNG